MTYILFRLGLTLKTTKLILNMTIVKTSSQEENFKYQEITKIVWCNTRQTFYRPNNSKKF